MLFVPEVRSSVTPHGSFVISILIIAHIYSQDVFNLSELVFVESEEFDLVQEISLIFDRLFEAIFVVFGEVLRIAL